MPAGTSRLSETCSPTPFPACLPQQTTPNLFRPVWRTRSRAGSRTLSRFGFACENLCMYFYRVQGHHFPRWGSVAPRPYVIAGRRAFEARATQRGVGAPVSFTGPVGVSLHVLFRARRLKRRGEVPRTSPFSLVTATIAAYGPVSLLGPPWCTEGRTCRHRRSRRCALVVVGRGLICISGISCLGPLSRCGPGWAPWCPGPARSFGPPWVVPPSSGPGAPAVAFGRHLRSWPGDPSGTLRA